MHLLFFLDPEYGLPASDARNKSVVYYLHMKKLDMT